MTRTPNFDAQLLLETLKNLMCGSPRIVVVTHQGKEWEVFYISDDQLRIDMPNEHMHLVVTEYSVVRRISSVRGESLPDNVIHAYHTQFLGCFTAPASEL